MTRATGQTVLQTLHFRQSSAERPTSNAERLRDELLDRHRQRLDGGRRSRRSRLARRPRPRRRGRRSASRRHGTRSRSRRRRRIAPEVALPARRLPATATFSKTTPAAGGSSGRSASSVRMPAASSGWPRGSNGDRAPASRRRAVPRPAARGPSRRAALPGSRRVPPPAIPPVARTTRAGPDRAAARVAADSGDRGHPPRSRSNPTTGSPIDDPAALRPQRGPQRVEQAQAGDARRDERDLERVRGRRRRRPSSRNAASCSTRPIAAGSAQAPAVAATVFASAAAIASIASRRRGWIVEDSSDVERGQVPPAGETGQLDRERLDAGRTSAVRISRGPQTAGRVRLAAIVIGPEVLEPGEPADHEPLVRSPRTRAAACALGRIAAGRVAADRRRDGPDRARQVADVRRGPSVSDQARNHSSAGATSRASSAYGWPRRPRELLDPIGRASRRPAGAADVDATGRPVGRRVARERRPRRSRPASASAIAAVMPASPAPTTTTSARHRRRRRPSRGSDCRAPSDARSTAPVDQPQLLELAAPRDRACRPGIARRRKSSSASCRAAVGRQRRAATRTARSATSPPPGTCRSRPGTDPSPAASPRRTSSRLHGQRASRNASSIGRVTSSHSHIRSASPPPAASCSASRWPSQ